MKPFSIRMLLLLLCALLCFTGCASQEPTEPPTEETVEETAEETEDPRLEIENLTTVITERTIKELEEYPNLKSVDLSGSSCYGAIVVYAQSHPQIDVTYTVDFGGATADNWATDVTLENYGVYFETLMRDLIFLPQLKSVHLPKTSLTLEELTALEGAYPDITFTYTVSMLGQEISADTEELDLSGMNPTELEQAAPALMQLKNLRYVELMGESGSALSKQDVKRLVEAAPGVNFHYTFNMFGKTISTTDETVTYKDLNLSPDVEQELRDTLAIMTGCDALILDNCGLDSEFLAAIREDYPNTELTWRVYFGQYSCLTNKETIRAVYNVFDNTCSELQYCRKAKYIDMGHNDTLTDLSFVASMPELEILIVSGCAVSDLSGFENCKKLEFLEMAYCNKLEDLTPLAGCENLKYLNICYTKVKDLQPLDGLPMELLFCKQTRVPAAEQETFKQVHENCTATFYGKEPYAGPGWRYVDNGKTFTEIYKKVREVFDYDAADKILRAQEAAAKNG